MVVCHPSELVVCHPSVRSQYDRVVFTSIVIAASQVDEGDIEIVNIRETDSRLGPLIFSLVGLGVITLVATAVFWWLTRPRRVAEAQLNRQLGGNHG